MAQLVTRVNDALAAAVDELVNAGVVESRSEAVRMGLAVLVDRHRRQVIGEAIVAGYRTIPLTEDDAGWPDEATIRMIADEPW